MNVFGALCMQCADSDIEDGHMAIKSLSIRIDEKMLDKLHAVADYEGRSANSQILILVRNYIEAYEKKCGKIGEA